MGIIIFNLDFNLFLEEENYYNHLNDRIYTKNFIDWIVQYAWVGKNDLLFLSLEVSYFLDSLNDAVVLGLSYS